MKRIGLFIAVTMFFAPAALAVEAPSLPASAKLLGSQEVVALYDGAAVAFDNFEADKPVKGTSHPDFKKGAIHGDYVYGSEKKKTFKGKIRMKGDSFCYKIGKEKEKCRQVYLDGSDIYEVDAKKAVTSRNRKQ